MTTSAEQSPNGRAKSNTRHREIVSTAARLFRERGYAGTTVRDLAKAVGVTSGSLFHHFGTKEEILLCVVDEGLRQTIELIKKNAHGQDTPGARLSAMVQAHLSALLEGSPETKSVMFYEWWSLSEPTRQRIVRLRDSYEALWDDAIAEYEGKIGSRAERRLKRLLLFGAMNWTTQWYRPGGPIDVAGLTKSIMETYFKPT